MIIILHSIYTRINTCGTNLTTDRSFKCFNIAVMICLQCRKTKQVFDFSSHNRTGKGLDFVSCVCTTREWVPCSYNQDNRGTGVRLCHLFFSSHRTVEVWVFDFFFFFFRPQGRCHDFVIKKIYIKKSYHRAVEVWVLDFIICFLHTTECGCSSHNRAGVMTLLFVFFLS